MNLFGTLQSSSCLYIRIQHQVLYPDQNSQREILTVEISRGYQFIPVPTTRSII